MYFIDILSSCFPQMRIASVVLSHLVQEELLERVLNRNDSLYFTNNQP